MAAPGNKVALITGGSRGIGAAIAERLARDGVDIALTYVNSQAKALAVVDKVRQLGPRALAIAADSSDADAVRSAVEQTVAEFGRIDILVNNAGIIEAKPIGDLTLDDFQRTVDVNVRSVFVASQAAAAHMGEGGRIISIGSNLAERVPAPGLSLYSLSKSALVGFTKGLARDLGPRGITVNVVHPGSTNTDMNPSDGEYADQRRSGMAIPHFAEPHDVANLVAWLAGEESRRVTGAGLTIDSGTNA